MKRTRCMDKCDNNPKQKVMRCDIESDIIQYLRVICPQTKKLLQFQKYLSDKSNIDIHTDNLSHTSNDIFGCIAKKLDIYDIMSLVQTCKRLWEKIKSMNVYWRARCKLEFPQAKLSKNNQIQIRKKGKNKSIINTIQIYGFDIYQFVYCKYASIESLFNAKTLGGFLKWKYNNPIYSKCSKLDINVDASVNNFLKYYTNPLYKTQISNSLFTKFIGLKDKTNWRSLKHNFINTALETCDIDIDYHNYGIKYIAIPKTLVEEWDIGYVESRRFPPNVIINYTYTMAELGNICKIIFLESILKYENNTLNEKQLDILENFIHNRQPLPE